jgi:membrane protease YdiL (CAAX protease family)
VGKERARSGCGIPYAGKDAMLCFVMRSPSSSALLQDVGTRRFFLLAFLLTWGCQLSGLLAHLGVIQGPTEWVLPLLGLGALGPLIAAVICSTRRAGGSGNRALFGRLWMPKVAPGWYLVAPFVSGALLVAGLAGYALVTRADAGPWFYLPKAPERIVAMVMFSIGEEVGWRGYALPRLRQRFGILPANLGLGVLWGLWHLPMFIIAGLSPGLMVVLILGFMPAGSVVFGWFFEKTRGSLAIAILLHMGAHLNNSHLALPANSLPAYVHSVVYVVVALLLIVVGRDGWRTRPTVPCAPRS